MAISQHIRRRIESIRAETSSGVYVVMELPGEVIVLVVPPGAEGDDCVNPMGSEVGGDIDALLAALAAGGDEDAAWGKVCLPMLVRIVDEPAKEAA